MTFAGLQLYQFIVAALALVMIGFGIERYIKGGPNQSLIKLLVRLIVWGSMFIITLFPKVTYWLARVIGIEGNINAVILIGFLLVFILVFKMLSIIERIEQEISVLTRQDALRQSTTAPSKTSSDE